MEETGLAVFSGRLRALRKAANMTQEEVSAKLNIHRTTYTKYETEKASPDRACLLELSQLFHVSVDYLLGRDNLDGETFQDVDTPGDDIQRLHRMVELFQMLNETEKDAILLQLEEKISGRTTAND